MKSLKSFSNERSTSSKVFHIHDQPFKLKKISNELENCLYYVAKKLKRPLKIGFDISSCPRYFILDFLGLCIKYEIAKEISFFYSEGKYEKEKGEYVHTKGDWRIIDVTGFEGNFNPEGDHFYIISAGFEGRRYRSVVSEYEPQKLGILLPIPGFNENYTEQVKEEIQPLIDEFNILSKYIVKAPAGDAIAAWNALKKPELNSKKDNMIYLTFGPKPHVLAMGLHALMNKRVSVLYRMPLGYTRMEVKPTGKFWRYVIKNLAIP